MRTVSPALSLPSWASRCRSGAPGAWWTGASAPGTHDESARWRAQQTLPPRPPSQRYHGEIEQALHRSSQVGDVPGPDLVWSRCTVGSRLSVLARHLSPAAMILHFFFMKNAVNGGFRGKIDPFVGENGHNLTGRHTGKAFFVHRVENRLALLCAEFIGGIGVICKLPSILVGPVLFVECLPAIVRPLSDA